MNDQPSAGEQKPSDYASILGDSEDSGEELSPEGVLVSSWERLPMLERLGLCSMEMTEDEVEDSFVQLALAFRCDQYTLKRRLQAEEHDRCVAEENLRLELERTKDTLQSLKVRCQDRERKEILEKLELSLENIGGTIEGIVATAEQLGTVHQEARATRSVELMVSHVENLNHRHTAESSELKETRRLVHVTRGRIYSDSTDDGDIRNSLMRQSSQQYLTRRRVSITLIPTMAQINDQESKLTDSVTTNGDTDSIGSERAIGWLGGRQTDSSIEILSKACLADSPGDGPSVQQLEHTNSPQEENPHTIYLGSPIQDTVRRRRKCVAAKEEEDSEEDLGMGAESECQFSDSEDIALDSSTPLTEQRPLVTWMSHCYWILLWIFLMVLSVVILLGVLLWRLRAPLFRL
ncbi:hypothetical protein SKAU_G00171980 [Synaphobranchus kaupii]|uniref:Lymphoid-restricted membrane protein-like n=1 Tax=Synaphobranchus kaupii TaxID=118154 RepID=A0A9Q1FKV0_SYNKA|nr:hypothetical protein SKAU_G00171980 [Synaphobranchus kaupii]